MAHFANRPFSDDGFVISNLKGLTFYMTVWFGLPSSVASSGRRIPMPSILFQSCWIDVQPDHCFTQVIDCLLISLIIILD